MSPHLFDSQQLETTRGRISEIIRHRFLLRNLVIRDLKARYKNSLLGIVWSLLNPLLMMAVYTILFTILIPADNIPDYPIFILVALIPWQFFNTTVLGGTASITSNAPLVKKVYFPRILLPGATLLGNLVNFALACIILVILLYVFGIGLTIHALWFPAILITQIIFTYGLIFVLSAMHTFYRDTLMVMEVVMLAWFFLTPIFYPFERFSEYAQMAGITFNPARLMRWLNPMASIVDGYRTILWGNVPNSGPSAMDPLALLRTFVTAVIVFIIGYYIFYRTEHLFGERL
jgi:ABC-type polysaccharide/polyol phosphate export permease